MKDLKSKIRAATIGIILLILTIITIKPFYYWCEGVYEDACRIMKIIQNRVDEYSWMDTQIEETEDEKEEKTSSFIERYTGN